MSMRIGDRDHTMTDAGPALAQDRGLRVTLFPEFVALVAGLLVFLPTNPETGLRALVWVSCGYAIFMVGSQGRAYLTPSGVYFLASGVFIGLASHYLLLNGSVNDLDTLRDFAVIAFLTTVTTAMVLRCFSMRWQLHWPSSASVQRVRPGRFRPPSQFQIRAIAMVLISQVPPVKAAIGPVAAGLGLAGVMMLVLAASARRVQIRWHGEVVVTLLAVLIPLLWVRFEYKGGGRLTLAGLGIAVLLLWNLARPRRLQKIMVVLAIPAFLVYSGLDRSKEATGRSVVSQGQGLESMYSPLDTWVELTQKSPDTPGRTTGPLWGETFYDTAVMPIPRSLWPGKPTGFGSKLTYMLRLDSVRSGGISPDNSLAALSQGEWYANFRYPGLVLMSVAIGWFLAVLDRAHLRLVRAGLAEPSTWWRAVCVACLTASLGDLFWVGTFTVFTRGGIAAIMAWIVWRLSTSRNRWLRYPPSATAGFGDQDPVESFAAVSDR